jgi:hypothetical protein
LASDGHLASLPLVSLLISYTSKESPGPSVTSGHSAAAFEARRDGAVEMARLTALEAALVGGLALDANVNTPRSALSVGPGAEMTPVGAAAVLAIRVAHRFRKYAGQADSRAMTQLAGALGNAGVAAIASRRASLTDADRAAAVRRAFRAARTLAGFVARADAPDSPEKR